VVECRVNQRHAFGLAVALRASPFLSLQGEHWVPVASFALAAAFRSRHAPHLSMETIVDLLSGLNQVRMMRIGRRSWDGAWIRVGGSYASSCRRGLCAQVWRKRENRKMARHTQQCNQAVAALKRKVQQSRPTTEVRLQAEVAWLKRELVKHSSVARSMFDTTKLSGRGQYDARPSPEVEQSFLRTEVRPANRVSADAVYSDEKVANRRLGWHGAAENGP
jgi:hypothetical protein